MTHTDHDTDTETPFVPPRRVPTLAAVGVGFDVLVVAAFTLIGRASHAEPLDPAGWWHTAWPFLAALGLGWVVVTLATRSWPTPPAHGVPVWITTVLGGMVLRALTGQGTATSFVVVATSFLGVTLLGWRLVLWLLRRRAG